MPSTPMAIKASFTASNFDGWMMATIFFMLAFAGSCWLSLIRAAFPLVHPAFLGSRCVPLAHPACLWRSAILWSGCKESRHPNVIVFLHAGHRNFTLVFSNY